MVSNFTQHYEQTQTRSRDCPPDREPALRSGTLRQPILQWRRPRESLTLDIRADSELDTDVFLSKQSYQRVAKSMIHTTRFRSGELRILCLSIYSETAGTVTAWGGFQPPRRRKRSSRMRGRIIFQRARQGIGVASFDTLQRALYGFSCNH